MGGEAPLRLGESEVRREHCDLMPAPREPLGQSAHLDDRAAFFLERIVRLDCL